MVKNKSKKEPKYFFIIKIIAIVISIMLLYIIIFGEELIFFTMGSIGGCVFLIKMFLEAAFPKIFGDY
jgi:hypothetical protein